MSGFSPRGRRAALALTIGIASLAIGAVFGTAGSGEAASLAAPVNTSTPTITGTPQQKQTLTASVGSWNNSPTAYAYSWSRCDKNGNACTTVAGSTAKTYTLGSADVNHTIRVTVTASNSDGSSPATSVPTAVVAAALAPKNTALPTLSGTVKIGDVLSVTNGTWDGNPTAYLYSWTRCDPNGNACAKIEGADGPQYKLTTADANTTVRAVVTAKNANGETPATSKQTTVVAALPAPTPTPAPAPTGCPSGTGVIQASSLSLPARLSVGNQTLSPGVVTLSTSSVQLRVRVTACNGRPVQGALVFAVAVPYNQFQGAEVPTGPDGTVTVAMGQRAGFPASSHQQRLAVFIRARKPGGSTTGDVSTHRLVTFPVRLH